MCIITEHNSSQRNSIIYITTAACIINAALFASSLSMHQHSSISNMYHQWRMHHHCSIICIITEHASTLQHNMHQHCSMHHQWRMHHHWACINTEHNMHHHWACIITAAKCASSLQHYTLYASSQQHNKLHHWACVITSAKYASSLSMHQHCSIICIVNAALYASSLSMHHHLACIISGGCIITAA